jgi:hypothetical protein
MPSSALPPLLLLLFISFAACKLPLSSHRQTPKNIPSFSFTTQKPLVLPLRVAVVLLGFDGTGQSAVTIDPVQLEEYVSAVAQPQTVTFGVCMYLHTVLPTRQPHDLNSGHLLHAQSAPPHKPPVRSSPRFSRAFLRYQLWYSVTTIHHKHGDKLYAALTSSLLPPSTTKAHPAATGAPSPPLPM